MRRWIVTGSVLALLSVALGAFGAHVLEASLSPDRLDTFKTGVHYHMIHAIGLLVIAALSDRLGISGKLIWASRLLAAGIVLFSGSLYVLCLSGITLFGAITPLGGVCFLAGWLLLALAAASKRS